MAANPEHLGCDCTCRRVRRETAVQLTLLCGLPVDISHLLEELADRCEKVATQIRERVAGEPITDRLVDSGPTQVGPEPRQITAQSTQVLPPADDSSAIN
jgi:hypothetical protein